MKTAGKMAGWRKMLKRFLAYFYLAGMRLNYEILPFVTNGMKAQRDSYKKMREKMQEDYKRCRKRLEHGWLMKTGAHNPAL